MLNTGKTYNDKNKVIFNEDKTTLIEAPKDIEEYIVPNTVIEIGKRAFAGCLKLHTIKIGSSVEIISSGAFLGCSSLKRVNLSEFLSEIGVSAFKNCSSLENFKLPSSTKVIHDFTFEGCSSLSAFKSHQKIISIGKSAFKDCTLLNQFKVPDNTQISQGAFYNTPVSSFYEKRAENICQRDFIKKVSEHNNSLKLEISHTELEIIRQLKPVKNRNISIEPRSHATYNLAKTQLFHVPKDYKTFKIPKTVRIISKKAFLNCSELKNVNIPKSVKIIEEEAFKGCSSLKSIELPPKLLTIRERVFEGCTSLNSIIIPDSVIEIKNAAFKDCFELETVYINGKPKIGKAFDTCPKIDGTSFIPFISHNSAKQILPLSNLKPSTGLYEKNGQVIGKAPKKCLKFIIPETVLTIKKNAFKDCSRLVYVNIPDSVKEISHEAFNGCSSIVSIEIPNSVTRILSKAFDNCTSLKSIKLPNNLRLLRTGLFANCTSLTSINIPDSVEEIRGKVFENCTSLVRVSLKNKEVVIDENTFLNCPHYKKQGFFHYREKVRKNKKVFKDNKENKKPFPETKINERLDEAKPLAKKQILVRKSK